MSYLSFAFRKHLGLARLVFEEVKSAKECVKHLHGRSVMGQMVRRELKEEKDQRPVR